MKCPCLIAGRVGGVCCCVRARLSEAAGRRRQSPGVLLPGRPPTVSTEDMTPGARAFLTELAIPGFQRVLPQPLSRSTKSWERHEPQAT